MKNNKGMKEEMLARLIEKTFEKISCPLHGNGVYAEIKKAVIDAYNLGSRQQEEIVMENIAPAPKG